MSDETRYCDQCGCPFAEQEEECQECGCPVAEPAPDIGNRMRKFSPLLFLVPWFLLLLYLGYTKSPYFKTAAIVNGQRISLSELNRRLDVQLKSAEEAGVELSEPARNLIRDRILNNMIYSLLLETTAGKAGIALDEAGVREEIRRYRVSHNLTDGETFARFVRSGYGSPEGFEEAFRTNRLLQLLASSSGAVRSSDPAQRQREMSTWLLNLQRSASVQVFVGSPPSFAGSGSCCGTTGSQTSGGGCGSGSGCSSGPRKADPEVEKAAGRQAIEKARASYGTGARLTAKVLDYGCHVQVDVYNGTELVASYTYENGEISSL